MLRVEIEGITENIPAINNVGVASGRGIGVEEVRRHATVAFIGNDLRARFFEGMDPLGKIIQIEGNPYEVVGVAKSTPMDSWGEDEGPLVYSPWRPDRGLHLLVVRSAGDAASLPKALAGAVKLELPTAVVDARTIPAWLIEQTAPLLRVATMAASNVWR